MGEIIVGFEYFASDIFHKQYYKHTFINMGAKNNVCLEKIRLKTHVANTQLYVSSTNIKHFPMIIHQLYPAINLNTYLHY